MAFLMSKVATLFGVSTTAGAVFTEASGAGALVTVSAPEGALFPACAEQPEADNASAARKPAIPALRLVYCAIFNGPPMGKLVGV